MKLDYEIGCVANKLTEFNKQVTKLDLQKQVSTIGHIPSLQRCQMKNEDATLTEIALLLIDTQKFFNVKNGLSEDMLYMVAELILSEYKHFNMYDIGLCLKMGKIGKFGKLYERLDGGTIMDWFSQYYKLRDDLIITQAETNHLQHKFVGTRTNEKLPFADKINKLK